MSIVISYTDKAASAFRPRLPLVRLGEHAPGTDALAVVPPGVREGLLVLGGQRDTVRWPRVEDVVLRADAVLFPAVLGEDLETGDDVVDGGHDYSVSFASR